MGAIGVASRSSRIVDPFNGSLGSIGNTKTNEQLENLIINKAINPRYRQYIRDEYSNNCALCVTAAELLARGYDDVEAMPRDTVWRGFNSVFDVDYGNPDNYILNSSAQGMTGVPHAWQITKSVNNQYNKSNPNLTQADIPKMPRGAVKAAAAIEEKVKSWGDGARGIINVKWADRNSAHVVTVINDKGSVRILDPQSGKIKTEDRQSLVNYLKGTTASHTQLIRLDNAPIRDNPMNLDKIVRRKNK